MTDTPYEPERLVRLRREREGYVKKRDELAADVTAYNGQIFKLDARIKEETDRLNGDVASD